MDEIQNNAAVASGDDWDDITLDDLTDEPEDDEDGEPAAEPETDQPTEEAEEQKPETEQPEQAPEKEQDQLFELKHLDETKTVNREEVIALAQKGMDYDRVREKYDAGKEAIQWYEQNADSVRWLEQIAKDQGMTFEEMVDNTRAQIMANETKQALNVCRGIVANERKAAQLEAQKKAMESKSSAENAKTAAREKMEADIREFTKAYPEQAREPDKLPKEVWDAVHRGETLTSAYRAYENKQLKAQLEQEKTAAERRAQEEKNKARSTGSQSTAGRKTDAELFDAAWYDGD